MMGKEQSNEVKEGQAESNRTTSSKGKEGRKTSKHRYPGEPRLGVLRPPTPARMGLWIVRKVAISLALRKPMTWAEAEADAEAKMSAVRGMQYFDSQVERLEMSLAAPNRGAVELAPEMAAVMRLPVVNALYQHLQQQYGGRPGYRSAPATVLFLEAFLPDRPSTRAMAQRYMQGEVCDGYAFGFPQGEVHFRPVSALGKRTTPGDKPVRPSSTRNRRACGTGESAFYASRASMVETNDPDLACRANIRCFAELAEMTDETGKRLYPDLGRFCSADGKDLEADVNQEVPRSELEKEWRQEQLDARGMEGVAFRPKSRKVNRTGTLPSGETATVETMEHWGELWGRKIVALTCLKSGLALAWKVIPADGDERAALREVLDMIFEEWPSCPIEYLTGDRLYDHSRAFARDLVFRYRITPCFRRSGKGYDADYCDGETGEDGVPACKHGLMKLAQVRAKPSVAKRIEMGRAAEQARAQLASGELSQTADNLAKARFAPTPCPVAGTKMNMTFKCAEGICGKVVTRAKDDPRVFTELPRAGAGRGRTFREVLLLRRLASESLNALIDHRCMASDGSERKAKGSDSQVEWLLGLGMLYLTARILVLANGTYDAAAEELKKLGRLQGHARHDPELSVETKDRYRREFLAIGRGVVLGGWNGSPIQPGSYHREAMLNLSVDAAEL
jgi:hypothetical protein